MMARFFGLATRYANLWNLWKAQIYIHQQPQHKIPKRNFVRAADVVDINKNWRKRMTEPKLSENALEVLRARYLAKDEDGTVTESPSQMFHRVAEAVAQAELTWGSQKDVDKWSTDFYDLMANLDFLPCSPTLMNAGRPLGQLSACFVLPVGDSMLEIFEAITRAALIHQSGGGTGFSFSRLRQRCARVGSTGGQASGPVSFMRVFNAATEAVKQGGTRRGANLGLLRVDHPDVQEFIHCKDVDGDFRNFNISVGITDEFMTAVGDNAPWTLLNPQDGSATKTLSAATLFDEIVRAAWTTGEPGVVFLNEVNREHLLYEKIEATNPCGEQPLLPLESCNLGSINLSKFTTFGPSLRPIVNYVRLAKVVRSAVRFLDNVVEVNRYPLPEVREATLRTRKIGLGVMGWADLLVKLHIPYDSEEGLSLAETVMQFIQREAWDASYDLAEVRGPFPVWEASKLSNPQVRNAAVTTIAPTGTLSMIANCTGGIEPIFALAYEKHVLDRVLRYVHRDFMGHLQAKGMAGALDRVLVDHGSCRGLNLMDTIMSGDHYTAEDVYVTAHEVSPEYHVRMQAAFQRHTDNAVSKTVNLPASATVDDVRDLITLAHKLKCKGITVYRDGCRAGQVLTAGKSTETKGEEGIPNKPSNPVEPLPRPDVLAGSTYKLKTGCGSLYVTVNRDAAGVPQEVFTVMGKSGGCSASNAEAVARLTSLALRSGVPLSQIVKQLSGIRCSTPTWHAGEQVLSCADALARVLRERVDLTGQNDVIEAGQPTTITCPECGDQVMRVGGCATCATCGWSKCG
jgi:ribonucleoside-diphosphate reductase alpha chain